MRHRTERALELLTVVSNQTARERRGAPQGDLLTQHRADGELVAIDGAGHSSSGRLAHQPSKQPLSAQHVRDAARIGVEVEQRARALHGGAEVAQVGEPEAGVHVPVGGTQLHHPVPCGRRRLRR